MTFLVPHRTIRLTTSYFTVHQGYKIKKLLQREDVEHCESK